MSATTRTTTGSGRVASPFRLDDEARRWYDDPYEPTDLHPYKVRIGDDVYSQAAFLGSGHRYYNFTSGVGAGKTVAGILRLAANVEAWNPGEQHMVVTPTTLGLKNVILPELQKWGFVGDAPGQWTYHGPQSETPGLVAANGSRVILESADNARKIQRLRGPSVASVWIDEPNNVPETALDILLGRLRTGNYRNLSTTGTPKGYNYVHRRFVDPDTRMSDVVNVLGVPSFANHHQPLDYRRDILAEYTGSYYDQEVLGRFVTFEGLVFPWFRDRGDESGTGHVVPDLECPGPDDLDEVIYGVDWGHNNPSVVLAIGRTGDLWWVLEEWRERRATVTESAPERLSAEEESIRNHTAAATEIVGYWGVGPVYCDPSEPPNIETFRRAGLPAKPAKNDVIPGIQHISALRGRLRVAESCTGLRNEFGSYRYRDGDESDRPIKQSDHSIDGLRYALFTHSQTNETRTHRRRGGNQGRRRVTTPGR